MGCGASKSAVHAAPESQPADTQPKLAAQTSESPAQPAATAAEAAPPAARPDTTEPPATAVPASQPTPDAAETRLSKMASSVLPKHVSADELGQLCQATNFDRKQVERLYEVFKVISSRCAPPSAVALAQCSSCF